MSKTYTRRAFVSGSVAAMAIVFLTGARSKPLNGTCVRFNDLGTFNELKNRTFDDLGVNC